MNLEEKVGYKQFKIEDFPHRQKGKFVILSPKTYSISPDPDTFIKQASYLRRELTTLYSRSKTLVGYEGPLGISKTTLMILTQFWNNMSVIPENPDSDGLHLLYQNIGVYGGPFQFDVGLTRKKDIRTARDGNKSYGFDRVLPGDRIFQESYCGNVMSPYLFTCLGKFMEEVISEVGHPHIICNLKAKEKTILDRIENRKRDIEIAGRKMILSDERMEQLNTKKSELLGFIRTYAPSEAEHYTKMFDESKIEKEIIIQGAPPEYVKKLIDLYDKRFLDILEELNFDGVVTEMNAEPIGNLDARFDNRGMYPLMCELRDATILSLLKRKYSIFEKPHNRGLKIIPPSEIFD